MAESPEPVSTNRTRTGRGAGLRLRLRGPLLALLLVALSGEAALRAIGRTDENGQFWLGRDRVRPYALPLTSVRRVLHELSGPAPTYLVPAPELGWTIRPGASSRDGLFHASAQGLRADRLHEPQPEPGVLRVAAFGDSFTHGDEVALAETWVARLEAEAASAAADGRRAGPFRCEALNFGVPAYGLDQAWLRWRKDGAGFRPHVVVLGFVAEDVYRLVNVMRPLYQPVVTIPFSKPRFVLAGGAGPLRLVNQPAHPPERMAAELEDFARSELAPYESYFDVRDYTAAWWQGSRLLAWVADLPRSDPIERAAADAPRVLAPEAEAGRLALEIVGGFRAEVDAQGGRFVLLHLPRRQDLAAWRAGEPLAYAELLAALGQRAELVDPAAALAARDDAELFQPQGHYAPAGHAIVAEALAPALPRAAPIGAAEAAPEATPAGR